MKLRVLAGPNAGAELALTEGDWLIGTDPEADLTFAEPTLAARHLRLTMAPEGVRLTALAEGAALWDRPLETGAETALEPGVPVAIGAIRFVLGDGPLREPPALPAAPPEPAAPAELVPSAEGAAPRRITVLAGLAMLLALLLPIGAAVWLLGQEPAPTPPRAVPRDAMLESANRVMRELDPEGRLTARLEGDRLIVAGDLATAERLQALQAAMRRAGLAPEYAIDLDTQMIEMVTTVLRAFALDAEVAITEPGRVRLTGYAASDTPVEQALRRMNTDIAALEGVDDRMVTPARARARLQREIEEARLGGRLRIAPGGGPAVQVAGVLEGEEVSAWAAIAERFRAEMPPPIQLEDRLESISPAAPRGVSLGRTPFVLMQDGQRLAIGDSFGGGTVVAIRADGIRLRRLTGEVDLPYAQAPQWVMEDPDGN